jgi:hypothetical protein
MKTQQATKWVITAVGTLLVSLSFLTLVLTSWQKVASGRGLETYFNAYGMELNHIVLVTLFAVLPIALLFGFGIQWWEWLKERSLKSNSGSKK